MKLVLRITALVSCILALSQAAFGVMLCGVQPADVKSGVWSDVSRTTSELGQSDSVGQAPTQLRAGGLDIVIRAGATLAADTEALAAFNRAAAQWEAFILDPVTVYVDADLKDMKSTTIIGGTRTVTLFTDYAELRDALVADAANEPDDGIVAALPAGASQIDFLVPNGDAYEWEGNISAAKANFKALGFTGLDTKFGDTDATITFNSGFAFDRDNSDGVDSGTMDLESVAAHELGHALGFISEVDYVDHLADGGAPTNPPDPMPTVLDLFRFRDGAEGYDPETEAEFTDFSRELTSGGSHTLDQIDETWGLPAEMALSTGAETGDGRQASHWKDDNLTGIYIGTMDPTMAYRQVREVAPADLRAMDLIGYELITIAEPCSGSLLMAALATGLALLRRRGR